MYMFLKVVVTSPTFFPKQLSFFSVLGTPTLPRPLDRCPSCPATTSAPPRGSSAWPVLRRPEAVKTEVLERFLNGF